MLSLFHSPCAATVCRLAVCATPQLHCVATAAMSTSAAALKPQSSAADTPPTAIVGGKPRGVRFFSPEAREWHDRLRTAWLAGWVRRSAPSNPCKQPKPLPHPAFQHSHSECSPFLGLGPTRPAGMRG